MPITVSATAPSGQELLAEVAADLEEFERFFQEKLVNGPLTPSEKAIIRTYLHWAIVDRHQG